ncbi:MAG: hypothetical protein FIA95_06930 [Gemmatimonadetes bacterium]|nr:hypothetical protein [Gemmatimonadota bacterium]
MPARRAAPVTGLRLVWALAAAPIVAACGDQGPVSGPGTLTAEVVSPNGAEGAALVTLVGEGLGAVGPLDAGRVFAEARGDTVRVVVVNLAGGTLRFTVHVPDTTRPPMATLVEVSGPDDRLRSLAAYRLELRP